MELVILCPDRVHMGSLPKNALLHVGIPHIPEGAEEIPSIVAVVHVELLPQVGVLRLQVGGAQVESEAVAHLAYGVDADNSLHRCIVSRTRIVDNLHFPDIGRADAVELRGIAHLPVVDVDFGGTFAEDLEGPVITGHCRESFQHIVGGASLAQHRVLYRGHRGIVPHAYAGQVTFDHQLTQLGRFGH